MADLGFLQGFNASDDQYDSTFELIKPGDYNVVVEDTEMRVNNQGTGEYLQVKLTIVDAPYEGRVVFDRFNLVHSNQKAVDIAQQQFAGLCRAAGVLAPSDSSDLHGAEVIAVIGVQKNGDYNEVKRYKSSEVKDAQHINPEAVQPPGVVPPKKKARIKKANPETAATTSDDIDEEKGDDLPF